MMMKIMLRMMMMMMIMMKFMLMMMIGEKEKENRKLKNVKHSVFRFNLEAICSLSKYSEA